MAKIAWTSPNGLQLLNMKFIHEGKFIEQNGDTDMGMRSITLPQLRSMIRTNSVSDYFHIRVCP